MLHQVTIREALQELIAWSQTSELKLTEHDEKVRRTALIRDWEDVFLELGDKQSLLASLKENQFFKTFEDQGSTFEVRMQLWRCEVHVSEARKGMLHSHRGSPCSHVGATSFDLAVRRMPRCSVTQEQGNDRPVVLLTAHKTH